jgi:hypothetical protein
MFIVLGIVNSHSVFSAIALETGVELLLDWFDSDEWSLVNHNQPFDTLYMIWTKTNKAKPVKAEVLVIISSISMHLLSLSIAFIAPPRQRHQKCVLVFINLTLVLDSHLLITYTLSYLYQVVIPGNEAKNVCWHYLPLLLRNYLIISCDQKEYKDMDEK